MIANIIHIAHRDDRLPVLFKELETQSIKDYKFWPGIIDIPICKGISRAHKQIIRWAKDNHEPEVLVFEDDIKMEPGAFDYYLQNKPENFDIYLGGIYRGEIVDKKVKVFTGLHCYIVSAKFYDTFLNVNEDIDIDHALDGLGDYHVCYPFAAIQHIGWSDNNRRFSDHTILIKHREIFGI